MVEIFKTNIADENTAKTVLSELAIHLPNSYINFDLEDCDNILRIENCSINVNLVVSILNTNGFNCELLQ
ncbi:hypothetical protein ACFSKN_02750 [Mariniflexile gromovii]|uniref:HMA domain-containing protein n=1 Tax=Mariniflexile gromovii TaxID=362523 RepID=A0ABS4BPM3_9FLAO|nr:hypothetical protein [Mariniflexile gromovii]MBP0902524.1 hypothetical protein [Mariniflexile gromovii]